ncbi:Lrp/AsnC family transcriptional regulator [Haloarcula nitratireducens]|uniref:Winged helix-turn-helix transcriptional regulator n=1 Tax=Haloarcula nitratireducens TaxID=2487749 RepID=A0AAW4PGC8_9EURY|nr:winged helix-turn-helix transcriptional regulator [Halomicroarcula nitratireducens]MBX0297486.1 winged helix-turn-helix transcriptional regulator [Halomicroarcula nitratireducens]
MRENTDENSWEFKKRDVKILRELSKNPQISSRELSNKLNEKYDIEISHVTISKSIRQMRASGVFREAIMPNENYFNFALFEFKFDPRNFDEEWEAAMEYIMDDPHTLMYFISNGEYQWKTIMMFQSREAESKWIHDFYKHHGTVVQNVRNSVVHNLLKFQTDPEIFELMNEG